MAKEKKAAKAKIKKKKSGKRKWILLILFLLLTGLVGSGYYFGYDKIALDYIRNFDYTFGLLDDSATDLDENLTSSELSKSVLELEKDALTIDKSEPDIPISGKNAYYVKVDECTDTNCEQEVIRFLKQEKLLFTKRKSKRRTKYYELISISSYPMKAAKVKIDLIKQESNLTGEPYLVRENNRYKISLGQFPQEDTGVRIKAGLAHLYPKLKIDFELKPKNTFFNVKSIYTGPFNKKVAESVLKRLQEYPEYESSEISQKLIISYLFVEPNWLKMVENNEMLV